MSETELKPASTLDEYSRSVAETWRKEGHNAITWRDDYAGLIKGEFGELLHQHGTMYIFLDSLSKIDTSEGRKRFFADNQAQYDGLVEELGDLLWFSFRTAAEIEIDPKEASQQALSRYTQQAYVPFQTFEEIEEQVVKDARAIAVPSKYGLRHPEELPENFVDLTESPQYVIMRLVFRLARALEEGKSDTPPYTASMMEPIPELSQSIGDCINIVAYVSRQILELPTEEVARRNIEKLRKRALNGKES